MKNSPTSTEGGKAYYVRRPLSDKHKILTLCVLCASAVNMCLNSNELINKNLIQNDEFKTV